MRCIWRYLLKWAADHFGVIDLNRSTFQASAVRITPRSCAEPTLQRLVTTPLESPKHRTWNTGRWQTSVEPYVPCEIRSIWEDLCWTLETSASELPPQLRPDTATSAATTASPEIELYSQQRCHLHEIRQATTTQSNMCLTIALIVVMSANFKECHLSRLYMQLPCYPCYRTSTRMINRQEANQRSSRSVSLSNRPLSAVTRKTRSPFADTIWSIAFSISIVSFVRVRFYTGLSIFNVWMHFNDVSIEISLVTYITLLTKSVRDLLNVQLIT